MHIFHNSVSTVNAWFIVLELLSVVLNSKGKLFYEDSLLISVQIMIISALKELADWKRSIVRHLTDNRHGFYITQGMYGRGRFSNQILINRARKNLKHLKKLFSLRKIITFEQITCELDPTSLYSFQFVKEWDKVKRRHMWSIANMLCVKLQTMSKLLWINYTSDSNSTSF